MTEELTVREHNMLERIYHSAGGVVRILMTDEEQKVATQLVAKKYLVFVPASYDLSERYDQWQLPQGVLPPVDRDGDEWDDIERADEAINEEFDYNDYPDEDEFDFDEDYEEDAPW